MSTVVAHIPRALRVHEHALVAWPSGPHSLASPDLASVTRSFVDARKRPPHRLSTAQVNQLHPVIVAALDRSQPHLLMTRRSSDALSMLRNGDSAASAFTQPQANPFGARGALYRTERIARERWLNLYGTGDHARATTYGEIAFAPSSATHLPGPRSSYGDVALVLSSDVARGASLLHRDSFAVMERGATAPIDALPDIILRSRLGRQAVRDARDGAHLNIPAFEASLHRTLGRHDHGFEQYIEAQVRPWIGERTARPRVSDIVEIRVTPQTRMLDELRAAASQRGIDVRVTEANR